MSLMKPAITIVYRFFILCLLTLSLPLQALIACLLFFLSGRPILFRQTRVGKNGKSFVMYKFRSMYVGADIDKKTLRARNEANGPVFKIHDDPRFTRLGKFLSHTGLDELPQIFNVFAGEMALIGPRPLPTDEAASLTLRQNLRHSVKPGIISSWVINGYHRQNFAEWMKSDVDYAKRKSLAVDLWIAISAIRVMATLVIREFLGRIH